MKKNNYNFLISTIFIPSLLIYTLITYNKDENATKKSDDKKVNTSIKFEKKQDTEDNDIIFTESFVEEEQIDEVNLDFGNEVIAEQNTNQQEIIDNQIPEQDNIIYETLNIINSIRINNGLAILTMDNTLIKIASIRAEEITTNWSHTRPDGSEWWTIYSDFNIKGSFGENLAYGQDTSHEVVEDWMNSETHKDNILNKTFTKTGIYVYEYNGIKYWVQEFSN